MKMIKIIFEQAESEPTKKRTTTSNGSIGGHISCTNERIADRIRRKWKNENDLLRVHDRFLSGCR